jgi:hypothetical protein
MPFGRCFMQESSTSTLTCQYDPIKTDSGAVTTRMVASGISMSQFVRMHSMHLYNNYFKADATLQEDTFTSAASTSNGELKTTGKEKVPASASLLLLPPPKLPILPVQSTLPFTHTPTPTPFYPSLTGGMGAALGTSDSSAGECPASPQKYLSPERLSISARPSSTGGVPQQLSEAPKEAEVSVHGSPRLSVHQRLSQFARSLRLSMRRSARGSRSQSLLFGQRRESAKNAEVPPPEHQDDAKAAPVEIEVRTASSSECLTVQEDSGTVSAQTDATSGAIPDPESAKSARSNLTVTFDEGKGRVFKNKVRRGSSAKAGQAAKQWTWRKPFASMGARAGCLSAPDVL